MKLMTYNILKGAPRTLDKVIAVVKAENPDYLTINEANTFTTDDDKILKQFVRETGFPYYEIARWESHYHVAALSKYPFKKIEIIQPLERVYIGAVIESPLGEMAIMSAHLFPKSENERLKEIEAILEFQKQYRHRVIMGDMNALSRQDNYRPDIASMFNEKQISKFTGPDKALRLEVVDKVLAADYFDPAFQLGKNGESTVPTSSNIDSAHAEVPMRLDYIFLSNSLQSHLKSYKVIKNELTEAASDHYPVVVEIS